MLFIAGLIFAFSYLPFAIALLMPTRRSLMAWAVIAFGLIAVLVIHEQHYVMLHPENDGDGLDMAFANWTGFTVAGGVVTRAAVLWLRSRNVRLMWRASVSVASYPILLALLFTPSAWHSWEFREPSDACKEASFLIDIAGGHFAIPNVPVFNIYLDPVSGARDFYLFSNKHIRSLCDMTGDGRWPVQTQTLWVKLEASDFIQYDGKLRRVCEPPVAGWAAGVCSAYAAAARMPGHPPLKDWPANLHIFALKNGQAPRGFGALASAYQESLAVSAKQTPGLTQYYFKSANWTSPDGTPFTARCHLSRDDQDDCETSYPWRDGVHLHFGFSGPRGHLDEVAPLLDQHARDIAAALLRKP